MEEWTKKAIEHGLMGLKDKETGNVLLEIVLSFALYILQPLTELKPQS